MNNWTAIRKFYAEHAAAITAEASNEWACDPYAWEEHGVVLTPIESWLWHDMRVLDVVLYPQYPIENFFVDFANPKAKVVIECDGAAFHTDKAKDQARDRVLKSKGWRVYRISGSDCRDGVDSEIPSSSKARNFVRGIADNHPIQRGA